MAIFHIPRSLAATVCLIALVGCSVAPKHPSLMATGHDATPLPSLVPVRQYVADWDSSGNYQISPDGTKMSWVARRGLGPGLFVKNLKTGAVKSFAVPVSGKWSQDSRYIYLTRSNGDENWHVDEVDTEATGAWLKNLTPFPGAKSYIHADLVGSSDLLIASNKRDLKVFDLYRYRQPDGELQLIAQNPGDVSDWLTDKAGQVVGRVRQVGQTYLYESKASTAADWVSLFTSTDMDTVRPLGWAEDSNYFWALSNRSRDKLALVKIDLRDGSEQVVFVDSRVDVSDVVLSRRTGQPIALSLDPDHQQWQFFDSKLQKTVAALQPSGPARITIHSIGQDDQLMVVSILKNDDARIVLVNQQTGKQELLAERSLNRMKAYGPLPTMTPVGFKSSDGLDLHGYLTLPAGVRPKSLPTVVYVHGGPWARDIAFSGDDMPLFLANRGYAVLQINYRGSSGYGRAFMDAAKREFGGKMQQDLLDGVDEMVRRGITDPKRVAIMGASYGGYATLAGMTLTPQRFVCGVSAVGISDLTSFIEKVPPYWGIYKSRWYQFIGNPSIPAEKLEMDAKSPINHVKNVQSPILLFHGALDVRTTVDQSTRFAEALSQHGKPVQLHVFPKAGHGFYRWPDRMTYFRKTEDFLATCLGGRSGGLDLFELASWAL